MSRQHECRPASARAKGACCAWYVPFNYRDCGRQHGGEFFEKMGAISSLLELLDDADDDDVVDALGVDLCLTRLAAWRRWRGVGHPTRAALGTVVEAHGR